MPTLADYIRLAPYTLDELVSATNGVLRGHPRLEVTRRTLRYYISEGVLPPPSGPPKFARYEVQHLLRSVAIRVASARGRTLTEARGEVEDLLRREDAVEWLQRTVQSLGADAAPKEDAGYGEEAESGEELPLLLYESTAPKAPQDRAFRGSPRASKRAMPPPRSSALSRELSDARPCVRFRLAPGITLEVVGSELHPGTFGGQNGKFEIFSTV